MCPLNCDDVARIFDDADLRGVSLVVIADRALMRQRNVEASFAKRRSLFDLDDCSGEPKRIFLCNLEQVESDARGGFRPDAGESAKFIDEILDGSIKQCQLLPL